MKYNFKTFRIELVKIQGVTDLMKSGRDYSFIIKDGHKKRNLER
jgi:hypothetical protein